MDHRYYLSQEYGRDVGAEAAIRDYMGRFGRTSARRWLAGRLHAWKAWWSDRPKSTNPSNSVQGAEDD